jgi:molybdopterin molybdotransferase
VPVPFPRVPDRPGALEDALRRALLDCDVILTNGGISVGDFDHMKGVLEALGAEEVFWRVAQKPGGPVGFWLLEGRPLFGIPGNPVAAMLIFETYVRSALRRLQGHALLHRPEVTGILDAPWRKSGPDGKLHFLRVRTRLEGDLRRVALTGPQGSGILTSMLRADALALVPEAAVELPAGAEVLLQLIDRPEDH